MIKKLRIKLVCAAMVSLLAVLAVIMGVVGVMNYREVVSDADSTLAMLAENGGRFPDAAFDRDAKQKDEWKSSPELAYESRYFSATLDSDGNVLITDTAQIAAVDAETAAEYAQTVWARSGSSGFLGVYRYIVYASEEETLVIFLDCGRSLDTFRSFVLTEIGVSILGLLAVLVLMGFLSARIVKPFSETYATQRQFITDAGHELKTPLTIIDADAEILEMDLGENEWLRDIQSQTRRLAEMTNSLVLLSRMEEEQPRIQRIEFPLSDVAEETVNAFRSRARTQNQTLDVSIQPMITYCGDETALRQLFSILLDNAIKYSGDSGSISVTLERQKNQIRLTVYNTADYVPRDSLAHLFDRFYRTDASRNSQTGGHGLGLSIAAAIVTAHKGKIAATTQDEKSLCITVTL